ncbi:Superoxide dismutase copper/zinc binding domain [Trinorchestia longiramus]|nr:Superoxide dismutase copper/zinc binding domain [Trinorchestia longiramus]
MACALWLLALLALLGGAVATEVLIQDDSAAFPGSPLHDPFKVQELVTEFERLEEAGLLPIQVPDTSGHTGATFSTTEASGTEIPVYVLAKIGLGVLKAAKIVGKGALVASKVAGAVQESVVNGGEGGVVEVTRNSNLIQQDTTEILADTAGTAAAFFTGSTAGELFFAQAFMPDGVLSNTVVTGTFSGLPRRSSFLLEVRDSATCDDAATAARVRMLGTMNPDATGRAALLLSIEDARVVGPRSIVGRIMVVVPDTDNATPVTCAVIHPQRHKRDPPQSVTNKAFL